MLFTGRATAEEGYLQQAAFVWILSKR